MYSLDTIHDTEAVSVVAVHVSAVIVQRYSCNTKLYFRRQNTCHGSTEKWCLLKYVALSLSSRCRIV